MKATGQSSLKGTGNKKKVKEKVRTYTYNKALVSLTLHAVPAILVYCDPLRMDWEK